MVIILDLFRYICYVLTIFSPQLDDKYMNIQKSFQTLGLGRGASPGAAKSAYRKLVKTYHPDRFAHDPNGSRAAEETIKEINDAYGRIQLYFSSKNGPVHDIIKNKGQQPAPGKVRVKPSGIIKKRSGQTNHQDNVRQNRASFATILEQAKRSQQHRAAHTYEKQVKFRRTNILRKVVHTYYSYACKRNLRDKPPGAIQEIKPVPPVPPVRSFFP
jgi:DnaJ domain